MLFLFKDINIIITTTTLEIVRLDWRAEGGGDLCGGGDLYDPSGLGCFVLIINYCILFGKVTGAAEAYPEYSGC